MSQATWSGPGRPGQPPILACLDAIESALSEVADVDPAYMSVADKKAALTRLAQAKARLDELDLRVQANATDVAADDGARDIAVWRMHHLQLDRGQARRDQHLASALELTWGRLATAMRRGETTREQAQVIHRALDALPNTLEPDVLGRAEAHLVDAARAHGPKSLRILGRRILDVVAPEIGEEHERKALEAEERTAAARTFLIGLRRGDGRTAIRGEVSDATWTRLSTYLEAILSPRQPAQAEPKPDDRRPYEQRLGAAFESFLESIDPTRLPLHGGDATTVIVTIDLASLAGDVGAAGVGHVGDEPLSAAAVRRLACTANVLPAVLGGRSEILDLGRSRRLFSRSQRKAMAIRDRCCRADGCTIPAAWCEAHHLGGAWSRGGRTDLADGALLCGFHHRRAHDGHYDLRQLADGQIRFHRRP